MTDAGQCPGCGAPLIRSEEPCPRCVLAQTGREPDEPELGPGFLDDLPMAGDVRIIADKYEVRRILGRGGMGIVYLAWQESLGRVVALKMLTGGDHASPEARRRFITEAKATAALRHPHIVTIHDWGEDQGLPYLSMEYVEGPHLGTKTRHGPLTPREAAEITRKVALAVAHANDHGVIHRDLKPSNILIGRDGEPKVADFGLAKRLDETTGSSVTGQILGTLVSLAPEQIDSRIGTVDARTDVYGLGALLYHLLTGRPPFLPAASNPETLRLVAETEPVPLRRLNPALPRDLETICLKCLAKDPARRYPAAQAFAEEVGRWERGEPIRARPVSAAERLWIWARRQPTVAALYGLTGLVVVAGFLAASLWNRTRLREAENAALGELQSALGILRGPVPFIAGWSATVDRHLNRARLLRHASVYRDHAAIALEGIDATRVAEHPFSSIQSLHFRGDSNTFLLLGTSGTEHWQANATAPPNTSPRKEPPTGKPIAFPREAPCSILETAAGELSAWDPTASDVPIRLGLPAGVSPHTASGRVIAAASADGTRLALVVTESTDLLLGIWDRPTGKWLRSLHLDVPPVTATLSHSGRFAAAGDSTGAVTVWDLADGTRLGRYTVSRLPVTALTFGPGIRSRPVSAPASLRGRLAVGDSGGTIGIWDLDSQELLSLCRGAHYQVTTIAFSPDRMTLASGGRGSVRLWVVATGQPVLELPAGDYCGAIAFNTDGSMLAHTADHDAPAARVYAWRLDNGRGVRRLHGLSSSVAKVVFAPDSSRAAALGMSWEVAVWDLNRGHLLRTVPVPEGITADNCGLALSPDGRHLATSAGTKAQLWDVDSGELLRSWDLPLGLGDVLTFAGDDRLCLSRFERVSPTAPLVPASTPNVSLRRCRLRNLLGAEPARPMTELPEITEVILAGCASPDGRFIALEGTGQDDRGPNRSVLVLETASGRRIWSAVSTNTRAWGNLYFASDGAQLLFTLNGPDWFLLDLDQGNTVRPFPNPPNALGPFAQLWTNQGPNERGVTLVKDVVPLLTLSAYSVSDCLPQFSRAAGEWLSWGCKDGTVILCHLGDIRHQLTRYGIHLPPLFTP